MEHFAINSAAFGPTVYRDEHAVMLNLTAINRIIEAVNHSAVEFGNGIVRTNGIESLGAALKRGFHGRGHGFFVKRIRTHIDELVFRLNEGNCGIDAKDRLRSLFSSAFGGKTAYKELAR